MNMNEIDTSVLCIDLLMFNKYGESRCKSRYPDSARPFFSAPVFFFFFVFFLFLLLLFFLHRARRTKATKE